ncbi:MAG: EamA family transporter [Actinobacteria bacterium]|nr:EamA family transporter [Actinomycetota bacterium]
MATDLKEARAARSPRLGLGSLPGPALVGGSMLFLQTSAALVVTIFAQVGPAGAALLRQGIAAPILWLLVRPRPRRYGAAERRLVLGLACILAVMNLAFYEATARLPLGVVVTVEFAGPLAVALLGSRSPIDLLFAGMASAGVVLIGTAGGDGGQVDLLGLAFAVLAAVCWGSYIVVSAATGARLPGVDGLALAGPLAAAALLAPGIVAGGSSLFDPNVLAVGAAVAVLSSVLAVSFEMEALRRIPRHVYGLLMSLEPAIGALAGLVVLGQRLSIRQLVAMVLVIIAAAGAVGRAPKMPVV